MAFFSCTVNEIGPAADGAETAEPVIYINLTDTGGSFANRWFYAAERSKTQMLSVGLAAMSTNRPVEAAIDTPDVPYSSVRRMYLMGPGRRRDETGVQRKYHRNPDRRKNPRSHRHQPLRQEFDFR